jgi:hypothetical protein
MRIRTGSFLIVITLTSALSASSANAGGVVGAKPVPVPPPKVTVKSPTMKSPTMPDPPSISGSTFTHEQWLSLWGVQTNLQHRRDRLRGAARSGATSTE